MKKEGADRFMAVAHALLSFAFGLSAELWTRPACVVGAGWVRGALAKADAHIADTYGPARTSPPEDLETV